MKRMINITRPPVDLERLTPKQQRLAHKFVDALMRGEMVCHLDFPEASQQEFEDIADAILAVAS